MTQTGVVVVIVIKILARRAETHCLHVVLPAPPTDAALPGNLVGGHYRYMKDLLALEAMATGLGPTCFIPATPLVLPAWVQALADHPDKQFAEYILRGISCGFHIGVDRARAIRPRREGNLPSVRMHPGLIAEHVRTEQEAGRLLGPVPEPLAGLCQTSPIGLIPKPHQPGKWRLIVDLSSPSEESVNDAIPRELCHLQYASVLDAAALVRHLGKGTILAKIDLHQAYRIIPVHPDELGVRWQGQTYIDTALPFGLRSAPKVFSAWADALAWVLADAGVTWQLHYLDDFLFLGHPGTRECEKALSQAIDTLNQLGVPLAAHKTEGPATSLTFLGIQIDSATMSLSLAPDKLARILHLVLSWRSRQTATKRQMQSLIGHLSHAAFVVAPGRAFLRRMIDLMQVAKKPHHHVRLTADFRSDLQWWASFLPSWNGRAILPDPVPAHTVTSDASGSWAVSDSGQYFQLQWPESWLGVNIAVKEMVPIMVATAIWGHEWEGHTVLARSDNMAVVQALAKGSARHPLLMHLIRCLHFFTARHDISIKATHVAGSNNVAADALSRNKLTLFLQTNPQAAEKPSQIPGPLVDMLVRQRPDWTSSNWRTMFISSLTTH